MRINVYAEELDPSHAPELVNKTVTDEKFGTRTFYGVRVWLLSPPELHNDPEDDDRSAITFWIPWTRSRGHAPMILAHILEAMAAEARNVEDGGDAKARD